MSDKKWFKIGEAAQLVGVGPKDLRYWEDVIADIKPRRSKGNLRYYHVDELPRLKPSGGIRSWCSCGKHPRAWSGRPCCRCGSCRW